MDKIGWVAAWYKIFCFSWLFPIHKHSLTIRICTPPLPLYYYHPIPDGGDSKDDIWKPSLYLSQESTRLATWSGSIWIDVWGLSKWMERFGGSQSSSHFDVAQPSNNLITTSKTNLFLYGSKPCWLLFFSLILADGPYLLELGFELIQLECRKPDRQVWLKETQLTGTPSQAQVGRKKIIIIWPEMFRLHCSWLSHNWAVQLINVYEAAAVVMMKSSHVLIFIRD